MSDLYHTESGGVNQPYCLLVNSCDAYSDCWHPFFTLLARYWQPHTHAIYLNTDTQAFAFPDLDIHCPRVGRTTSRDLTWSDRLLRCLESIPYEIVLYLQEDYFIKDTVDVSMIDWLVDLMAREGISHVSLERSSALGRGEASSHQFLSHIAQNAKYRISTQAGLWRVSALRSYLRRHETVWEFEWCGTIRARRKRDAFLYVNEEYRETHGKTVIPYDPTGLVHGRWARDVVEHLFADHGIDVEYGIRGFYDARHDPWKRRPLLTRAVRRLRSIP
jgi:hypothetical protein